MQLEYERIATIAPHVMPSVCLRQNILSLCFVFSEIDPWVLQELKGRESRQNIIGEHLANYPT